MQHIAYDPSSQLVIVRDYHASDVLTVSYRHGNVKLSLTGFDHSSKLFPVVRGVRLQGNAHLVNHTSVPVLSDAAMQTLPQPTPPPDVQSLSAGQQLIFQQMNAQRALAGLPPLQLNSQLQQMAQNLAGQEGTRDTYGDGDTNGHILDGHDVVWRAAQAKYNWAYLGENVGYSLGQANPAQDLMTQWLGSPDHLANILNASYTEVGIGIAQGASGRTYSVVDFGKPA